MNVLSIQFRKLTKQPALALIPTTPARLQPRERDFGIGYGRSSGYASNRRYTSESFQPLFRCA